MYLFRDLAKFEDGIGEKVPMFINFIASFIALLVLALIKGWELALICLVSLPVTMIALGVVALVLILLTFHHLEVLIQSFYAHS